MHILNKNLLITTPLLLSSLTKAYSLLGCYSSLPSSFGSVMEYTWQSSSYCYSQCSGYSYFALSEGNGCYCGNDAPSGDTTSGCTTACFGYNKEMCGGSGVYDVYAASDNSDSANDDSNTGSTETTATSDTTTLATKATTSGTQTTTGTTTGTTTATTSTAASTTATSTETTSQTTKITTELQGGTTVVIYSTIDLKPSVVTSVVSTTTNKSSPSSTSTSSSSSATKKSSSSIVGRVVGGVVGGAVAIILLVLLILFLRRRNSSSDTLDDTHIEEPNEVLSDSAYHAALKRDKSTASRPLSNPFLSKEEVMIDQRLNPVLLGRRRISEGSLADEADYSRKILRVANPDDEL
ncbi:hypothetical protein WICPIJ_006717 [Wickerhamomyces pijperi]|uniref:WSC domain-containing protein n=1 Tax=Wickerhamomyces pijperi TaxID=599730 RepID=A0A9P8Q384_WICPI|nr:hypothetical protein WICPIJ_006717 [Wickerhamomyces pijperi]